MRRVKGLLFADYVRMIRGRKDVAWEARLAPDDVAFLRGRIEPTEWYPMTSFERLGNAILDVVAGGNLDAVRLWGRAQVDPLRAANPMLVDPNDPIETLARFKVLRAGYFDFDALELLMIHEGAAEIAIRYHMGMPAEEAASVQTMGFFERLLELSGATGIDARFTRRSWEGASQTVLALRWAR